MKRKASRAWKRLLAGLLTMAMVVCLLSSAPLSVSASAADEGTVSESIMEGQKPAEEQGDLDDKEPEDDKSAPGKTEEQEDELSSESAEASEGTDIDAPEKIWMKQLVIALKKARMKQLANQ